MTIHRFFRRKNAPITTERMPKNKPRENGEKLHWGNDEGAVQSKLQVEYPMKNPITNKIIKM